MKLVIHWPRFGPYHLARLNAAFFKLKMRNVQVVGMETASHDEIYSWQPDNMLMEFERYVVFPGRSYHKITLIEMWLGVWTTLNRIRPDVVAVTGYTYRDSWAALTWCLLNRRPAVLMTESKMDDRFRIRWLIIL